MSNALITILTSIVTKLVTERFFSKMIVIGLDKISQSTKNDVDDRVVSAVDEALGYPCGKKPSK